jgi:hypothetical protein
MEPQAFVATASMIIVAIITLFTSIILPHAIE